MITGPDREKPDGLKKAQSRSPAPSNQNSKLRLRSGGAASAVHDRVLLSRGDEPLLLKLVRQLTDPGHELTMIARGGSNRLDQIVDGAATGEEQVRDTTVATPDEDRGPEV